jgi:peptide/nickel transport system ATP-binding protein
MEAADKILTLEDLDVHFPIRRSVGEVLARVPGRVVRAVNGVSLSIRGGTTLGLVGESGSGKTTISRAIMGLVDKTAGDIQLLDFRLPSGLKGRDLSILRHLQMVFQNPEEALNPYLTVAETLRRPLMTLLGHSRSEAELLVGQLLKAVKLPEGYARRLPGQLSGGEKQRVAIARAFATNPNLLIFDEPVSSLDVSVQASILNLLNELQDAHLSTQLFISHDLAVVGFVADQIAVIYLGQLMEIAQAEDLFEPPYHPYTEALLSAIPLMDPDATQKQIRLEGEIPSPADTPTGCPFHTRCPRYLGDICATETPPWQEDPRGTRIFCHIPIEELVTSQTQVFALSTQQEQPDA